MLATLSRRNQQVAKLGDAFRHGAGVFNDPQGILILLSERTYGLKFGRSDRPADSR
jgi:hypothetical protein